MKHKNWTKHYIGNSNTYRLYDEEWHRWIPGVWTDPHKPVQAQSNTTIKPPEGIQWKHNDTRKPESVWDGPLAKKYGRETIRRYINRYGFEPDEEWQLKVLLEAEEEEAEAKASYECDAMTLTAEEMPDLSERDHDEWLRTTLGIVITEVQA